MVPDLRLCQQISISSSRRMDRGDSRNPLVHLFFLFIPQQSEFILNKFREKLTGKFKFTPEEAETAVALLLT
jgi:hypothetical protein